MFSDNPSRRDEKGDFFWGPLIASKRGAWYVLGGRRLNKKVARTAPGAIYSRGGAIYSRV